MGPGRPGHCLSMGEGSEGPWAAFGPVPLMAVKCGQMLCEAASLLAAPPAGTPSSSWVPGRFVYTSGLGSPCSLRETGSGVL